ncbi:hypothetical protein HS088_TW03G00612 [Tripterygium wilfordii]|uniref:KIB1-4 beta-propeller domain-containing protein n=1 Tax=Tripterygium wilfordii TaxID=458696 RepID=A0A7J7DV90_TRIWF|nr:hypothetical protein HS088_TW03G00612 [Tripterygium wilfordii]
MTCYTTLTFNVFKLDAKKKLWIEIGSLGDRALFVGRNESISIGIKDCKSFKQDSIYFSDDFWASLEADHLRGQPDIGLFCFEDREIQWRYEWLQGAGFNALQLAVCAAPQENIEGNGACEVVPPDTLTNWGTSNARTENFDGGNTIDGSVITFQSASPDLKMESSDHRSSVSEYHKDNSEGGSFEFPGGHGDSGQRGYTNKCADLTTSAEITGATVQVPKKPSHGFGALLGNATSKRKFDTGKRVRVRAKNQRHAYKDENSVGSALEDKKAEEPGGGLRLKPFDYATARTQD